MVVGTASASRVGHERILWELPKPPVSRGGSGFVVAPRAWVFTILMRIPRRVEQAKLSCPPPYDDDKLAGHPIAAGLTARRSRSPRSYGREVKQGHYRQTAPCPFIVQVEVIRSWVSGGS